MIVVDASVLANALADDEADGRLARDHLMSGGDLVAPDLVDVETVSVLRRRWLAGDITARRFSSAIDDLEDLSFTRFPVLPLMRRAYELRANVTAYDAAYVALARAARLHPGHGGRTTGQCFWSPVPRGPRHHLLGRRHEHRRVVRITRRETNICRFDVV